ncbi:putative redox protein [Natronospira proteinivora]|uniref:Redox protein n=1 Tax=Natronospira proteinivora TaxID=1807133 RepID=A0ABT1GAS3_9GAMM|nr:OsmC family protein [Natronospira proteinivora]MCP1728429.1 putative redox protein [Natronospira proteinivora]
MKASIEWDGEQRFRARSESGHEILMDGDRGKTGPSPMETVLMAAGSCSSVDVVGILEKARQAVTGCRVELSAKRAEGPPSVFTEIHMHFIVTGEDVGEHHVERAVRLSADKYCSVSIMLGHSVKVSHSSEVRATGP